MKIGDPVLVRAISKMEYDYSDGFIRRQVVRTEAKAKAKAVLTGRRTKMIGLIRPSSRDLLDMDYEPATFDCKGTVEFWEVRTGLYNKPLLVADDDIEPTEPFDLPRMSKKII